MTKTLILFSVMFGMSAQAGFHYTQEVKVIDPAHRYLRALSKHPELIVDHPTHLGYEVYGPNGLQAFLTKYKIKFVNVEPLATKRLLDNYPSAEDTVKKEQDLQKQYPSLITLIEIGKSVEGRSLMFARITAPATKGRALAARPEFKFIANMHGDEIVGRELMIKLIEDLASNYGKDQRITQILDNTQVYILPSMNPDGATHKVRYNAHGVDLNRSFPDFTTSDNVNDWHNREPEIQAVMKFQAQHNFKLSANFHGGSEVVNYPWDTDQKRHPLDSYLQQISLNYTRVVPYLWNSTEFKNGITNGYDWYEVDGGMQDWSYYWHKDIQLTIELSGTKWPDYSTVANYYQANRPGLLEYIEETQHTPTPKIRY
ncbi:MAG: DUF2817 domain-containing protein [Bdellovibrionales bacterium]|nr:DUF2817 domain-containing protein [Bdellovibrionales bacterium]